MAERKNSGKRPSKKKSNALPIAVIFWAAFFIIITGFFLINRETIKKNFTILSQRFNFPTIPAPEETEPVPPDSTDSSDQPVSSPVVQSAPASPETPRPTPTAPATTSGTPPEPALPPSPVPQPSSASQPGQKPAAQPTTQPPAHQSPLAAPQAPSASQPGKGGETRERNIYFTQVDKDGAILRSKVTRKIAVSDSPMLDSLNALLTGPSAEEQRKGLVSLVPRNTRILSAAVRGGTAYISFSEEFQYNTYGVEGYAAQLNQIVWTATEFSNIKDVQILIEGRRVDYLGEGIWIGGPVNRESL